MTTRLRLDPPLPGLEQMRRDQQYYSLFEPETDVPLLRFYTWSEKTVSLGRFQTPGPEFRARLADLALPSVQRPTGGKAILHAGDLTFSLIGPSEWLPGNLLEGHALITQALMSGLRQLGITADAGLTQPDRQQPEHCFATATPADIQVLAGKLLGTAQVKRRQAFLLQGMLYLKADKTLLTALFGPSDLPVIDLTELLGGPPDENEVIRALCQGFSEVLGLNLVTDPA